MNFSEKLDFLMNLTKTSNKELAEALYFSQSYVSKLRRGHRTLNDNVSIEKIGAFLSSRIFLPSQIAELKKTVNWIPLGDKPDNEELKVFLLEMFYFNNIKNTKKMNEILNHLSTQRKIIDNEVKVYSEADLANRCKEISEVENFSYIENKKKFLRFLEEILLTDDIDYSFISSNTDNFGFKNDSEVLKKVEEVLYYILEKNIKLDVIINIANPLIEVFNLTDKSLYILFKKNVNIWYIFEKDDRLTSHLIFGVSGVGIYNCYGLKGSNECDVVMIYDSYNEYKRVETKFLQLITKVDPLAIKYNYISSENQLFYSEILLRDGVSSIISSSPTLYSMPKDLLVELFDNKKYKNLFNIIYNLQDNFIEHIKKDKFVEIIDSSFLEIENNEFESFWGYKYTKEQLIRHLKNILILLREIDNYHLIESDNVDPNLLFHINKKHGILMFYSGDGNAKTEGIFAFSPVVISLIDGYLSTKYTQEEYYYKNKIIKKIEKKIDSLL